jgi:hypothetical protein
LITDDSGPQGDGGDAKNKSGNFAIRPQFSNASEFSDGLARVAIGTTDHSKYGFINADGKFVINPELDNVSSFSEGMAVIKMADVYGYVDKSGKISITPQFSKASDFKEGVAAVKVSTKWGLIDKSGLGHIKFRRTRPSWRHR